MSEEKKAGPVQKYQAGQLTVSVWKNKMTTKDGKEYDTVSMQLQNRYKDGDDWKESKSIRINQVPKAISLLQRAYDEQIIKSKEDFD